MKDADECEEVASADSSQLVSDLRTQNDTLGTMLETVQKKFDSYRRRHPPTDGTPPPLKRARVDSSAPLSPSSVEQVQKAFSHLQKERAAERAAHEAELHAEKGRQVAFLSKAIIEAETPLRQQLSTRDAELNSIRSEFVKLKAEYELQKASVCVPDGKRLVSIDEHDALLSAHKSEETWRSLEQSWKESDEAWKKKEGEWKQMDKKWTDFKQTIRHEQGLVRHVLAATLALAVDSASPLVTPPLTPDCAVMRYAEEAKRRVAATVGSLRKQLELAERERQMRNGTTSQLKKDAADANERQLNAERSVEDYRKRLKQSNESIDTLRKEIQLDRATFEARLAEHERRVVAKSEELRKQAEDLQTLRKRCGGLTALEANCAELRDQLRAGETAKAAGEAEAQRLRTLDDEEKRRLRDDLERTEKEIGTAVELEQSLRNKIADLTATAEAAESAQVAAEADRDRLEAANTEMVKRMEWEAVTAKSAAASQAQVELAAVKSTAGSINYILERLITLNKPDKRIRRICWTKLQKKLDGVANDYPKLPVLADRMNSALERIETLTTDAQKLQGVVERCRLADAAAEATATALRDERDRLQRLLTAQEESESAAVRVRVPSTEPDTTAADQPAVTPPCSSKPPIATVTVKLPSFTDEEYLSMCELVEASANREVELTEAKRTIQQLRVAMRRAKAPPLPPSAGCSMPRPVNPPSYQLASSSACQLTASSSYNMAPMGRLRTQMPPPRHFEFPFAMSSLQLPPSARPPAPYQ